MPLMKVDVRVGETVRMDGSGSIAVTLASKSGQRARLEIRADESVRIHTPRRVSQREIVKNGLAVG